MLYSETNEAQRPRVPAMLSGRGFYNVQSPWVRGAYMGNQCHYSHGADLVYVDKVGYSVEVFAKMWDEDRAKQKREYIKYKLDRGILS